MANTNSTQITAILSSSGKTEPSGLAGRVRVAYFNVASVPTGAGDTMTLTRIPKGARVLGGKFYYATAQGATATTAIGISGSTGKYRAAATTNATSEFTLGTDGTVNYGGVTTAEEEIIATNAAAAWTACAFAGHILYVVD